MPKKNLTFAPTPRLGGGMVDPIMTGARPQTPRSSLAIAPPSPARLPLSPDGD